MDEEPDAAVSLPLGAGRLTAGWLPGDPPEPDDVRALRRHVRAEIARIVGEFSRFGAPDHVVATSKTFRQLARHRGRGPLRGGPVRAARAEARVPGGAGCRGSPR